ncbi:MAG TPA: CBS domain-containing protein [Acidisarcina sp.]|nr:CBS domain-containing protein [Acidisarcina sp.]
MQQGSRNTATLKNLRLKNLMMRGWSFPLGRWMGVDVRIHTFFVLLLGFCLLYTSAMHISGPRGFGLWLLLGLAVTVREVARVLAAAYYGLKLRSILLLPIGGLYSYANPESQERSTEPHVQTAMAIVGPLANLCFAVVVGALIMGAAPQLNIFERPWVTPNHLIRSIVWLNLFLGFLNMVPAYPLDAGRLLRSSLSRSYGTLQANRTTNSIGQVVALLAFIAGIVLQNPWLVMAGFFIFIGAQLEDQGVLFQSVVDTVQMRDVMLTDFATLSPSDTLEDALYRSIHCLQDDFPVVRGNNLVGIVSRQRILDALRSEGNGYVQSVMSRAFQVAQPDDSLGSTIRRITAGRGLSLVPVTEGERIVGIVSLQNLMHSMGLLAEHRRLHRQSQE